LARGKYLNTEIIDIFRDFADMSTAIVDRARRLGPDTVLSFYTEAMIEWFKFLEMRMC